MVRVRGSDSDDVSTACSGTLSEDDAEMEEEDGGRAVC